MTFTIKAKDVVTLNGGSTPVFPKYTTQLMNLANQNGHGTRPNVVGQMSDLFPEYERQADSISLDGWKSWYLKRQPHALEAATDRIMEHIENLREALKQIDRDMVYQWTTDLVLDKTYHGMYLQQAILATLADQMGKKWRLATPQEEARGIDGYVGETAYSIKPDSYRSKNMLPEEIQVQMVYYTKGKDQWTVSIED